MKLFSKLFPVMCAISSTLALDESETIFESRETPVDRKLQTLGNEQIGSCADQMSSCYAKDPPLDEWASMLKAMDPKPDSIFADLILLVESLENIDMTNIGTISEEAAIALTTKTMKDLQEVADSMEVAGVEEDGSQVSENQIYSVMKTVVGILGGFLMNFGFNPMWLTIIAETLDRIIVLGPVDVLPSLVIVAQALITYASPLLINFLQTILAPASTSRSITFCSEAMNCQFSQMVSDVVPALVSGAFAVAANVP